MTRPPETSIAQNGLPPAAEGEPLGARHTPAGQRLAASVPATLVPWWELLIIGTVTAVFGIAVLAWPEASLKILAVLIGIWLLLSGILRIAAAFLAPAGASYTLLSGITGTVLVVAALICLRNLVTALAVLALFLALSWIFSGLTEVVRAARTPGRGGIWLAALGVFSILVGLVFLFIPEVSLTALVLVTGISAIVGGVAAIIFGVALRTR